VIDHCGGILFFIYFLGYVHPLMPLVILLV
jgi:hypothetical protein